MAKQISAAPSAQSRWTWDSVPDLPQTHYLDNRIYTDEALFEAEMARIFKRQWKFVCHESELERAGDYRAVSVADSPVFVVKGEDGAVRAFLNICPHRGARLLREARGNLRGHRLSCFYHHWTFSTAGECVTIPLPQGYKHDVVRPGSIGLRAVPVGLRHGLVFVKVDDSEEGQSLDDFLGVALDEIATPIKDLEVFHYHRVEVRANWKLFVETNCEGYHELLHFLNRTTALSQPEYMKRKWLLNPNGHHTFQPARIAYGKLRLGDRSEGTLAGMAPNMHIVVDLFPDCMINARSTVVRMDSLVPVSPGLTILECRGLAPKGDSADQRRSRVRQHNQVWGPLGRNLPEDIWAIETQWANMASGGLPYSIIAREDDNRATDDAPLRSFYAQWQRLMGVAPFNIAMAQTGSMANSSEIAI